MGLKSDAVKLCLNSRLCATECAGVFRCGDAVEITVGIGGIMRPVSKNDLPHGSECGRFTSTLVLSYNASSFFSPR